MNIVLTFPDMAFIGYQLDNICYCGALDVFFVDRLRRRGKTSAGVVVREGTGARGIMQMQPIRGLLQCKSHSELQRIS